MSAQEQLLPEPREAKMSANDTTNFVMLWGELEAVSKLQKRLKALQREFPHTVGLELAVSQCLLIESQAREDANRLIITTAAKHQLPIDG